MTRSHPAVLITGASRGLGAALARAFGERGARLALVARNAVTLSQLAAELRARGVDAHALAYDIGDQRAVHPLAATAAELVGPIDVLIHNASDLGPVPLRSLLDTQCEDLERALAVNLVGPFRLSKLVAGSMALRRSGTIVHVSSDAAVNAYPGWGAYGVSKAALDHLSRSLSVELREHGVRVFSVDPGDMDTDLHRAAVPDADPSTLGRPEDVAGVIVDMVESGRVEHGARLEARHWPEAGR